MTVLELTKSEWIKIMAKGKSKVLLILLSIFAIGACIIYYFVQSQMNLTLMEGELFPIWLLNRLMSFILPLLAILMVVDTISGEFQEGTIKNMFSVPATRNTLYVSKLLSVALYILLMLGIIAGISFIGAVVVSGFSAFAGLGNLLIAYLGAFIILGLIVVMAAVVSLFVSSSSFALVINLLLWLSMGTISIFLPKIAPYLPTSYTHWYDPILSGGNFKVVIPMLLYMISYYIILIILGMLKFQKKEG